MITHNLGRNILSIRVGVEQTLPEFGIKLVTSVDQIVIANGWLITFTTVLYKFTSQTKFHNQMRYPFIKYQNFFAPNIELYEGNYRKIPC